MMKSKSIAISLVFASLILALFVVSRFPHNGDKGNESFSPVMLSGFSLKPHQTEDTSSNGGMMSGHNGMGIGMGMMKGYHGMGMMRQANNGSENNKSGKWVAPAWADTLDNPVAGEAKATVAAKKIYANTCAICHGNKGKGNGIAGANLVSKEIQKQSDGAIYWKMTTGNPPMASYKEKLSDEQRWELVNYIRELARSK